MANNLIQLSLKLSKGVAKKLAQDLLSSKNTLFSTIAFPFGLSFITLYASSVCKYLCFLSINLSLIFFVFSADGTVVQAGDLNTYVIVHNDGRNSWSSPASFKSTCSLDVRYFPFDKQKCNMTFRSLTADLDVMDIETKSVEHDDAEKGMLTCSIKKPH